jgi:hypothetical protein
MLLLLDSESNLDKFIFQISAAEHNCHVYFLFSQSSIVGVEVN